jgi:hypothetical protein
MNTLTSGQIYWLTFLATRRDIFSIPTANCLGSKFQQRNDGKIDPNRDFSYNRKNNKCFLSTTAKIFQSLMNENIIQVVVTFHGGMIALGYEWGVSNHPHPHDISPDQQANHQVGNLLADFAGIFESSHKKYPGKFIDFLYDLLILILLILIIIIVSI